MNGVVALVAFPGVLEDGDAGPDRGQQGSTSKAYR